MVYLLAVFALYLLIILGAAWISVYPVRTPLYLSPEQLGMPCELIGVPGPAGNLPAWICNHPNPVGTVVLAHGYIMNRSEMVPTAHFMYQLGFNCVMLDFRAHGRGPRARCTCGLDEAEDIQAVARIASDMQHPLIGAGSSMGSAAIALATGKEPALFDALLLDSCYSFLPTAAGGWWQFLGGTPLRIAMLPTIYVAALIGRINPWKVDIAQALTQCGNLPIQFLHGAIDNLAPISEANRNLAACSNAALTTFEGCGHADFRWNRTQEYFEAVETFIMKVVADYRQSSKVQRPETNDASA